MSAKWLLLVVAALAVACSARRHRLCYASFDHVLDYDPDAGTVQAFDFARHLKANDTCEALVHPPLIAAAPLVDVVSASMNSTHVTMTYLGNERFMHTDGDKGYFMIRRCSGFMPQQTTLPCEVYAVGEGAQFKDPYRYFYGGENRVVRYDRLSQAIDLLFYDSDVHGGGNPFGTLLSGRFSLFSGTVDFAYVNIDGRLELLLAQEHESGSFKVWHYNPNAKSIEDLVGQLVIAGQLLPGYRVKTLGENMLIAYNENNGDFETWRFLLHNDRVEIETVSRDNVDANQHGCVFDDRQTCIKHSGCGWCADSITCHRLSSDRTPCDGTKCLNIIDDESPDSKKYQSYELPIPSALREFGDAPADNPKSPLRELSHDTAVPIGRDSDLESEAIEGGMHVNPSEGLVFVPPPSQPVPCMDDRFVDHRDLPLPNIRAVEDDMNAAKGVIVPTMMSSPEGEKQEERDCNEDESKGVIDVIGGAVNRTAASRVVREEAGGIPQVEAPRDEQHDKFMPSNDGTAIEEDLMNSVRSHYSSLMAKGDNVKAVREDANDPPLPLSDRDTKVLDFKPRDNGHKPVKKRAPQDALVPAGQLYDAATMEAGIAAHSLRPVFGVHGSQQAAAMNNAQFKSPSIFSPPHTPAIQLSLEHSHDTTGSSLPETQLAIHRENDVTEGWELQDVPVVDSQLKNETVEAPESEVDPAAMRAEDEREEQRAVAQEIKEDAALAKEVEQKEEELAQPLAAQEFEKERIETHVPDAV